MRLVYENEIGTIDIGGLNPLYNLLDIDGIYFPEKSFNVINYNGEDGQHTLNRVLSARIITFSFEILRGSGSKMSLQSAVSRAIRIFNTDGILHIYSNGMHRKIKCYCTACSPGERNLVMSTLVVQLTADNPYFTEAEPVTKPCFVRYDLPLEINENESLYFDMTNGVIFTRSTNNVNIINDGDVRTEPLFRIVVLTTLENAAITVTNATTGQSIVIENVTAQVGEEIIIDIGERRIYGSTSGNLINNISDDTYLNEFWIECGENNIITECSSGDVTIAVEYENKHIEAVY